MSIASEISRLQTLRNNIRAKLIALGLLASSSADLEDCYDAINGITAKAAATYTPGTSDQTIAAGQYLSGAQTISGDSNLIPGNIASGVSIFGVTGILTGNATPGSLIKVACTTDIDAVTAVVNSTTYTAYLDTTYYYAYIVIPYTITSGSVTVYGYSSGSVVATDTVTISGIDKYCAGVLSTDELYNAGTWNILTPSWYARSNGITLRVTTSSSYLILTAGSGSGEGFSSIRYPVILPQTCTAVKVTLSTKNTPTLYFGIFKGNTLDYGDISEMTALSTGENTFTVSSDLLGEEVYFWFGTDSNTSTTTNRVTKIELTTS